MAIDDPMFGQFPEHDAVISEWFERQGWPVTMRHFDFDRDVFAWRHEGPSGDRTIRVTQATLEDYPAERVVALFDSARVSEVVAADSDRYVVLRRQSGGGVGFSVLDGPPTKSN